MSANVTVCIPVGPLPVHQRWLPKAIQSVREQTYKVAQILIIDDMAGMPWQSGLTMWHAPWHLGVATAFNCGVALAQYEYVFLLGSDDKLLPTCIEECMRTAAHEPAERYFSVGVEYSDGRGAQFQPCNAAMVTKALWRATGGFPVEAATGAPDAAFISILLRHRPETIVKVNEREPLYWYRVHEESDTAGREPWQQVILATRSHVTEQWQPPAWGRMKP